MQQLYRPTLYVACFVLVFAINGALKWRSIKSEMLIKDDLNGVVNIMKGQPVMAHNSFFFWTIEAVYLAAPSLVAIRMAFLVMLGLCGVMTFHLLRRHFINDGVLLCAVVAAFCSAHLRDQINFLAGSHALHGLFWFLVGMVVAQTWIDCERDLAYAWAAVAGLFFFLGMWASPVLACAPAGALTIVLSAAPGRRLRALKFILFSLFTYGALFLIHRWQYGSTNHYEGVPGFLVVAWKNIRLHLVHFAKTFSFWIDWNESPIWTLSMLSLASLGVLWCAGIVAVFALPRKEELLSGSWRKPIWLLACLGVIFAFNMFPSTLVFSSANRYLVAFAPVFCLAGFLLIDQLQRFRFPALRLVSSMISVGIVLSTVSSAARAEEFYEGFADDQDGLRTSLLPLAKGWRQDAQVIVITDIDFQTTGYIHWSTGLTFAMTKRQDVHALIGTDRHLKWYPFLNDSDAFFSEEHWALKTSNGRSRAYRKRMVGLDLERPTYGYRLTRDADGFRITEIESLAISTPNGFEVYPLKGQVPADCKKLRPSIETGTAPIVYEPASM